MARLFVSHFASLRAPMQPPVPWPSVAHAWLLRFRLGKPRKYAVLAPPPFTLAPVRMSDGRTNSDLMSPAHRNKIGKREVLAQQQRVYDAPYAACYKCEDVTSLVCCLFGHVFLVCGESSHYVLGGAGPTHTKCSVLSYPKSPPLPRPPSPPPPPPLHHAYVGPKQ